MISNKEGEPLQFVKVSYVKKLEHDRAIAVKEMADVMERNFALQERIEEMAVELLEIKEARGY